MSGPRTPNGNGNGNGDAGANGQSKPLIGISMGDPLGVGPEVIFKALLDPEIRNQARFIIFGLHDSMDMAADLAEVSPFWWREPYDGLARVGSGVLLADFDDYPVSASAEHGPDEAAGRASFRFVQEGVKHLRGGSIDALVTGPICKESWAMCNQRYAGHTDYLARTFETKRIAMAFVAGRLRVALASDHIPLFELRNRFSIGMVHQPIDLLSRALHDWFGIDSPHIGVLGLNPHAGENGLLGDDEQRIIEPALTLARNAGIRVSGPLPADTAFTPEAIEKYDGLVAMYHDQGLIPVKMMAFHDAVNVTLGLPVIRTSPDHGTAFNIAGRNKAHPGSMTAAIKLAIRLAIQRKTIRIGASESKA